MNASLLARILVEAIGTFLLALTVLMVVLHASHLTVVAPLAVALTLTAIVYAGGSISGAMYNPAMLLLFALGRKLPRRDWGPLLLAQFGAAAAAAGIALMLRGTADIAIEPHPARAMVAEGVFTFALAWVTLAATSRRHAGNQWYGIAIGFVVGGGAWAVGTVSGAAFNPAVWLSLACTGKLPWTSWWIYFISEAVAVVLAVACHNVIEREPRTCEPTSPS